MTGEQNTKRLKELQAQTADISFSPDVYGRLRSLLRAALKHFETLDPYILDLDTARLEALLQALPPVERAGDVAMRRLSHLDMFDLERLSLASEDYFDDLGGADVLDMEPPQLTALTETLGHMRTSCFAAAAQG